ncbi:hypothetical protein Amn_45730 [Aminobacter sp. Y103A]|uniref:hypothetical protein n=1 Tax=Aminobacter sp. Y103A TaxID=1870862 RepID=UPI0025736058|nr:hypothetical protein [Aminobacter sp. SS-2016]BBD39693.1 hypothetical protein Amn_45730 [Aminobacter sp. SS-2016]
MNDIRPLVLPISLIVVSDYLSDDGDGELRQSLQAYLHDRAGVPAETIVMLPAGSTFSYSADPGRAPVAIVTHDSDESSQLKDAALPYCHQPLIAVVEADCLPLPGWMATLHKALDENPAVAAVSGRTSYGHGSMMKRVMSLLDRGFIECPDRHGKMIHVSSNGAIYRRALLERYRFRPGQGPFVSAHLRQDAMNEDGVEMAVDPRAVSIHAYEGLGFIWDVRRNKGYQFALMKLRKRSDRTRLGLAVSAVMASFRENRRTIDAVGDQFCRATDRPLLWLMMLAVRVPEFFGALAAGDPAAFKASTRYR